MIVLDASVAVKLVLTEQYSDKVLALVSAAAQAAEPIVAPPLLPFEIANVLRQRMVRQGLSLSVADQLMADFLTFPIGLIAPSGLYQRALAIADAHQLPAAYDAHYVALAEELGGVLWTDDQRLLRALGGRLAAVDRAGGKHMAEKTILLVEDNPDDELLALRDSGRGMDAETESHLFEPFFTTREPGQGTGLGLATVYGIVQQSGGYVDVASQVGQGTTFTIYLPRVEDPVAAPGAPAAAGRAVVGTETILLVEDEEQVRTLAHTVLADSVYTVLAAAHGEAAIWLAVGDAASIDLLLTDVVMPGMSGPQLAQRLQEERPGLRVAYMSGHNDETILHQNLQAGGVSFLPKPFLPDQLAHLVRAVLDASRLG